MSEKRDYFNLHVRGLGYLDRVREIRPKRGGKPFLAVDVTAIHGPADATQRTRFQCIVRGREAERVVRAAARHLEAGRKVLAGFKLGDLYAELYRITSGERAGEQGVALKARLLAIHWVKVDGRLVYSAGERGQDERSAASA